MRTLAIGKRAGGTGFDQEQCPFCRSTDTSPVSAAFLARLGIRRKDAEFRECKERNPRGGGYYAIVQGARGPFRVLPVRYLEDLNRIIDERLEVERREKSAQDKRERKAKALEVLKARDRESTVTLTAAADRADLDVAGRFVVELVKYIANLRRPSCVVSPGEVKLVLDAASVPDNFREAITGIRGEPNPDQAWCTDRSLDILVRVALSTPAGKLRRDR